VESTASRRVTAPAGAPTENLLWHAPAMSAADRNLRSVAQGYQYDAIADRIAGLHPQRVLDWGCGWGQITHRLRQRGVTCEAFDYWPEAPDGVDGLERYPDILVHHSADPVRLPFEDGRFDLALSCGVLEHVANPDGSLDELHRVTAPGGSLLIYNLPNRFSYLERVAEHVGCYYHGKLEHDRVYTARTAREIVSEHGFRVEDVRRRNLLPLSVPNRVLNRYARQVWTLNDKLAKVPMLPLIATTVEVDATRL
jgi:ubiquinone/menaquinone biosynthesis C-methylase UbiE